VDGIEAVMSNFGPIVDRPEAGRLELVVDGLMAYVDYQLLGTSIIYAHTEVPGALEGRGVGYALARAALDLARERGLQVVPLCPFIAAYIRRHPEYLDLVSPANRRKLKLERRRA
jgi:predicted GNAT family acetyltransferase